MANPPVGQLRCYTIIRDVTYGREDSKRRKG